MAQTARDRRYSHSESIRIDATPQQVWDVVTRIERTGEWSPICRAAWWKAPATGLEVGAWFCGRNEADGRIWETESLVVAAEEPVEFTWLVMGNAVRWSYTLTPEGDGTSLTESWAVQPEGFQAFEKMFGKDADAQLEVRRDAALSGIPATLKAIKRIVEDSRSPALIRS
ncbi:SRPBCC family protein [Rhodococcus sp. 14C212]|uniref:SRPBCC family protein n=1 Tax=Rhodococcus sp. 14C212 TaxID=2711209 RepID=UPI0013E9E400|nr:SRPBCC family protein [Rhodococcus sp. 14C212]NGP09615.1 SRPBCC family protein [Rhodococcus sp. 14C212]